MLFSSSINLKFFCSCVTWLIYCTRSQRAGALDSVIQTNTALWWCACVMLKSNFIMIFKLKIYFSLYPFNCKVQKLIINLWQGSWIGFCSGVNVFI